MRNAFAKSGSQDETAPYDDFNCLYCFTVCLVNLFLFQY